MVIFENVKVDEDAKGLDVIKQFMSVIQLTHILMDVLLVKMVKDEFHFQVSIKT